MKNGSLISPDLFREFMMEPMKRVTRTLNEHGIDIIMVDSDGNDMFEYLSRTDFRNVYGAN